MTSLAHCGIVN